MSIEQQSSQAGRLTPKVRLFRAREDPSLKREYARLEAKNYHLRSREHPEGAEIGEPGSAPTPPNVYSPQAQNRRLELRRGLLRSRTSHVSSDRFRPGTTPSDRSTAFRKPASPQSATARTPRAEATDISRTGSTIPRRPNPFAKARPTELQNSELPQTSSTTSSRGWGFRTEDEKTLEQTIDTEVEESLSKVKPLAQASANLDERSRSEILTHVKSSGEAHMVDVGAKVNTKRAAIAVSYVRFARHEPCQLISENGNKKGDVLGVARIAGIMASKRTSDLIPLCHPIAISKVDVDIQLMKPKMFHRYLASGHNRYGMVAITAHVECTGATGVEMEALTAASTAALTIYDMCKAVDRNMSVVDTVVVYKSGGKSGIHCRGKWSNTVGQQFFIDRGLELPAQTGTQKGSVKETTSVIAKES
ncbi:hypothetical protein D0869_10845 [Lecanosticta acicola]|uniref:cyclic pyranopterin monophosphate synthase n=1 Tax=Lecanosticta acicola TaxID=111012 RepID=A0AAI8Z2E4_9PEZI|nr:hypothetical protein D0869_10845 [Lecanosticta acicola]